MPECATAATIVAHRAVVVPGVRRGLLRRQGTLVVSADRLIFLPHREGEDDPLRRLRDADGDAAIEAVDAIARVAAADEHGLVLPRGKRGLAPPDEDGRLRLLTVGEEEDLLIPLEACPLLTLVMGLRGTEASTTPALLGGGGRDDRDNDLDDDERRGWAGPISSGSAAFLTVIVLPVFLLLCLLLVEEVDDELGALVYIMGALGMLVLFFATVVGAAWAFFRREATRIWGIAAVPFSLVSGLVLMALSVLALEKLF